MNTTKTTKARFHSQCMNAQCGWSTSYDNALAETINGLYKAELIHRCGPWKTTEAVEIATLE